jgi:dCMP deaminase
VPSESYITNQAFKILHPKNHACWLVWRFAHVIPRCKSTAAFSQLTLKGICAGKHAVAEYLTQHEGFKLLELAHESLPQISDGPEDDLLLEASQTKRKSSLQESGFVFETIDDLLGFATKRWEERWVTTDIWDMSALDRLLLRPFFLLVSVDAPVSLRWQRFRDR